ncbi:MAG: hypothetical protein ABIH23_15385 [bacterium]
MSSSGFGISFISPEPLIDLKVIFTGVLIALYVLILSVIALRNPSVVRAIFYPFANRFDGCWKCAALLIGIWMLASFLVAIWLFSQPEPSQIFQRV